MKKMIKISSSLTVAIGTLIAAFSFGYTYLKNEKEKYNNLISQINENCNELYSSDMYRKQELYYNGKVLSWVVRMPDSIASEELDKSLNEDKLVLLFSESTCSQCVEAELKNINRKMKQLKGKVIIVIKSDNKRYVSQFKINNKLEYPCFCSLKTNDSLMIDMPPFYFVVEKNSRRMNSVFFPQKEKAEKTGHYLQKVISDYFNTKSNTSIERNDSISR